MESWFDEGFLAAQFVVFPCHVCFERTGEPFVGVVHHSESFMILMLMLFTLMDLNASCIWHPASTSLANCSNVTPEVLSA